MTTAHKDALYRALEKAHRRRVSAEQAEVSIMVMARAGGLTLEDIGKAIGKTKQRAWQILAETALEGSVSDPVPEDGALDVPEPETLRRPYSPPSVVDVAADIPAARGFHQADSQTASLPTDDRQVGVVDMAESPPPNDEPKPETSSCSVCGISRKCPRCRA